MIIGDLVEVKDYMTAIGCEQYGVVVDFEEGIPIVAFANGVVMRVGPRHIKNRSKFDLPAYH